MSDSPLSSYPKVLALGHRRLACLYDSPAAIEEKIDGSQFSFRHDLTGDLHFKSKRAVVHEDNPGMFAAGVQAIRAIADTDLLFRGYTYRGEYLRAPKHNTLTYARVPKHHVILWDIEDPDGNSLSASDLLAAADRAGLETVPNLGFTTERLDPERLDALLDRVSCLGGAKIEGVVVKNRLATDPTDGKILVGKFVSEQFKEKHVKGWKDNPDRNRGKTEVLDAIKATYRSEARWRKAVQRLRDEGKIEGDPRDIGRVMAEAQQDLEAEEAHEIKERLWKSFRKEIVRASTRGLAEWYKRELASQPLEENPS